MGEQPCQPIIDAFFEALRLKDLAQCRALLQALAELARQVPAYRSWQTFLSGIYANEGDYDWAKGERLFISLLATEPESSLRGRVLNALGITYRRQGRWHEAIKVYEQCLALFDQPDQALERVKTWKNLATVLEIGFTQGDLGVDALHQAIEYCRLALETLQVIEKPGQEELWLEAITWNTLGMVYRSLGNWPQATRCYERYIALDHAIEDLYDIGMASNNLGEVLQQQGPEKWAEAQQAYLEALKIYREFADKYEEVDVLANLGSLQAEMDEPEQALDYYDQAIQVVESLRAGVSAEGARAGFFATTADIYAQAICLSITTGRLARAFGYMERARSRAFLDLLGADSPHLAREQAAEALSLAEVQAALPPDALLLEYFTMGLTEAKARRRESEETLYRHRQPPSQTLLFAVSHDNLEVFKLDLDPNDLFRRRLNRVVERYFLDDKLRAFLYDKLVTPVAARLSEVRRLYLVPHGPLHYIPFQALGKEGRTLLDQTGLYLSYAPSATILLRHCRATATPGLTPALSLGYNGQGQYRLQYAEEEAESIAHLLGGQALTGSELKKAKLFQLGPNAGSLHFSCHGQFDPQEPMASALYLGADETLTAAEILPNLSLKTHLVTLSACETGLSRVLRGDELLGLVRAFIFAGTPAVISTLWRVEEQSTRILMERFYQELKAGAGVVEALKLAQQYLRQLTQAEVLDLLSQKFSDQPGVSTVQTGKSETLSAAPVTGAQEEKIFSHPFFWAPFILIGGFEG